MNTTRRTHAKRPCPNCPSLLEVIEHVIKQIETESEAPMSIGDLDSDNRQFLASLKTQLHRARELATAEAA